MVRGHVRRLTPTKEKSIYIFIKHVASHIKTLKYNSQIIYLNTQLL